MALGSAAGWPRLAAALGLAALIVSGCAGATPKQSDDGQHFIAGPGTITTVSPADRRPAPPVSGTGLDGQTIDLSTYRGKVVVLNFWASWCAPCVSEAPDLERVYQATKAQGVQFIGVNIKDGDRPKARAFMEQHGLTYPTIVDQPGVVALAFRKTLPPDAIPTTLVIDRDGRVAARGLGALTTEQLQPVVEGVAQGTS